MNVTDRVVMTAEIENKKVKPKWKHEIWKLNEIKYSPCLDLEGEKVQSLYPALWRFCFFLAGAAAEGKKDRVIAGYSYIYM